MPASANSNETNAECQPVITPDSTMSYSDIKDTCGSPICAPLAIKYREPLGISQELRKYKHLLNSDVQKVVKDFSDELQQLKRGKIIKDMTVLCVGSFLSCSACLPMIIIQTSIQCTTSLGYFSLSAMYGAVLMFFYPTRMLIRYHRPRTLLLCGLASHVMFMAATCYPSYATMISAAMLSGIGHVITWHVQAAVVSSLALRHFAASFHDRVPPLKLFHSLLMFVSQGALFLCSLYTWVIFNLTGSRDSSYVIIPRLHNGGITETETTPTNLSSCLFTTDHLDCNETFLWESTLKLILSCLVFLVTGFLIMAVGFHNPDIILQQTNLPIKAQIWSRWTLFGFIISVLRCLAGCHQAFVIGDMTQLVSSSFGIKTLGLVMCSYAIARFPGSLILHSRWRERLTISTKFFCLGCIVVVCCYLVTVCPAWGLLASSLPTTMAILFFWGIAEGMQELVIAGLREKHLGRSYQGFNQIGGNSFGMAIGLVCAPLICAEVRLYVMSGTISLVFLVYISTLLFSKRKNLTLPANV